MFLKKLELMTSSSVFVSSSVQQQNKNMVSNIIDYHKLFLPSESLLELFTKSTYCSDWSIAQVLITLQTLCSY